MIIRLLGESKEIPPSKSKHFVEDVMQHVSKESGNNLPVLTTVPLVNYCYFGGHLHPEKIKKAEEKFPDLQSQRKILSNISCHTMLENFLYTGSTYKKNTVISTLFKNACREFEEKTSEKLIVGCYIVELTQKAILITVFCCRSCENREIPRMFTKIQPKDYCDSKLRDSSINFRSQDAEESDRTPFDPDNGYRKFYESLQVPKSNHEKSLEEPKFSQFNSQDYWSNNGLYREQNDYKLKPAKKQCVPYKDAGDGSLGLFIDLKSDKVLAGDNNFSIGESPEFLGLHHSEERINFLESYPVLKPDGQNLLKEPKFSQSNSLNYLCNNGLDMEQNTYENIDNYWESIIDLKSHKALAGDHNFSIAESPKYYDSYRSQDRIEMEQNMEILNTKRNAKDFI